MSIFGLTILLFETGSDKQGMDLTVKVHTDWPTAFQSSSTNEHTMNNSPFWHKRIKNIELNKKLLANNSSKPLLLAKALTCIVMLQLSESLLPHFAEM